MLQISFPSASSFNRIALKQCKDTFLSDKAIDKETDARELRVKVNCYGEDFTYGIRYISKWNIAMRYEVLFETSCYDDEIECVPRLEQCMSANDAWKFFETKLKQSFDIK